MEIEYNLTVSDVEQPAEALVDFHAQVVDFFRTTTRSVASHALDYLRGQLLCETRRTMARRSVTVVERDEQALSNVISTSPWADEPLLEAMGGKAVRSREQINVAIQADFQGRPGKAS